MGLWGIGGHSHLLEEEVERIGGRCRHICKCGTGQDRVLIHGSVFIVNYKQNLLALRVEEMGTTPTTNSKYVYWELTGAQLLYIHFLIEPPSQPSEV